MSRKLSDKDKGVERQPGEGTGWGSQKRKRLSRSSAGDRVFGGRNGRVPFGTWSSALRA